MDGHFGSLKGLGLLVSHSHWHLSPLLLQLWKSDDFGQTWIMIQEHVKSFSWYVSHPAPVFSHSSLLMLFAALWEPRIRVPGCVPALPLLPSPCAGGMCHSRVTSDSHPHWHPRVLPIPPAPSPCSCCLLLQSHHVPCPPQGGRALRQAQHGVHRAARALRGLHGHPQHRLLPEPGKQGDNPGRR